jgi:uncharacterized protein (DUF2147 family)
MNALMRALLVLSLTLPLAAPADEAGAILGRWTTAEAKSIVEIYERDGLYHGRIVALKEPLYPEDPAHDDYVEGLAGKPKVDRNNPDEALRGRPIVGLNLMSGFGYDGDNVWSGGTIYDPESGKTYKCKLTLVAPDELNVRGYVGISLFGRTTTWTR